jgi:lambda family phage minor tail protein L
MQEFESSVQREIQGSSIGEIVVLFSVDATAIGGGIYRFAPNPVSNALGEKVAPVYDGQTYFVVPCEAEGFEWSAGGTLPQPVLRFGVASEVDASEVDPSLAAAALLIALVEQLDDLLGAKITRVETLRKHLDDGDDPNPLANLGVHMYEIEQKSLQTYDRLEFSLRSGLDHEGVVLPRRQALNRCQWDYRLADGEGGFDYSQVTCPYQGAAMFDLSGEPVATPEEDRCPKLLKSCKLRFGADEALPFGGFPGSGRIRTS